MQRGPSAAKSFPPGSFALAPPPSPRPLPAPPPPHPHPSLSGARPATRAHSLALPLAHTHGRLAAKFRLRSPLPDPAAVFAAVTLNFPSAVTRSPCFPHRPASCAPPPAFFFFFLKHFITHHHPIPIPNPRAPQAPNNNNCKAENKSPKPGDQQPAPAAALDSSAGARGPQEG